MAESLDSRKFERKSMFDVPLPIRKVQRDKAEVLDDEDEAAEVEATPPNTMAFSLMTKKGNRQQVSSFLDHTDQSRRPKKKFRVCVLTQYRFLDANNRTALGLQLRCVNEISTSCRTRGAAAYQESGP